MVLEKTFLSAKGPYVLLCPEKLAQRTSQRNVCKDIHCAERQLRLRQQKVRILPTPGQVVFSDHLPVVFLRTEPSFPCVGPVSMSSRGF